MPTLGEQVQQLLPKYLPKRPEDALSGNQLLAKMRHELKGDFSDNSVRQYFSYFAKQEGSPIVRKSGKMGYFLRPPDSLGVIDDSVKPKTKSHSNKPTTRDDQPEEKFRAFFCKFQELKEEAAFAKVMEHTTAKKQDAGLNKWKFPDVVIVEWEPSSIDPDATSLMPDVIDVMRSLAEQPFRFKSVELKVSVSAGTLRELFFQCVSNSKWAHCATLAIAIAVDDQAVADELARLGASYGVEVVSFGMSTEMLDKLPSAKAIRDMRDIEFEALSKDVEVHPIATATYRDTLDWKHLADMRLQSNEFVELFKWVQNCLEDRKIRAYDAYVLRQRM